MNRQQMSWLVIGGFFLACGIVFYIAVPKSPPSAAATEHSRPLQDMKTLPPRKRTAEEAKVSARNMAKDSAAGSAKQRNAEAFTGRRNSKAAPASAPSRPAPTPIDRKKPLDQYIAVESEVDAGLMCFARSGADPTDTDYDNFANLLSSEYRATIDSIAKQKMLDSLKHQMQEKLAAFKSNPYFVITQKFYLEHYDATKKSFPVVATQGIPLNWLTDGRIAYFARTTNYILRMSNAKAFSEYKVTDESAAQELEARAPGDRTGQGTLYLFARDTEPGSHTIRAEIVKARLHDNGKDLIAELEGANRN